MSQYVWQQDRNICKSFVNISSICQSDADPVVCITIWILSWLFTKVMQNIFSGEWAILVDLRGSNVQVDNPIWGGMNKEMTVFLWLTSSRQTAGIDGDVFYKNKKSQNQKQASSPLFMRLLVDVVFEVFSSLKILFSSLIKILSYY